MKKSALILLALLAGCEKSTVYDGQIVCTTQGAAYTLQLPELGNANVATLFRSPDADGVCAPMKGIKK